MVAWVGCKKNHIATLKVTWLAIMKDLNPISQVTWHYRRLIFGLAYGATLKWTQFFVFRILLIHWSKPKRKTHFSILRFFESPFTSIWDKYNCNVSPRACSTDNRVWNMSLVWVQNKQCYLLFHILLRYFFIFHHKIYVFIVFISFFFDKVSNFHNRIPNNQKEVLVIRNFHWNCMYKRSWLDNFWF